MTNPLSMLVRRFTWPFYAERDARGSLAQWRALEASQWWKPAQLEALRLERLRALLMHAFEHCPFHADRMRAAGVDPRTGDALEALRRLPILEKRDIQDHRHEMRATNLPPSDLIENKTGGSTGSPLVFDVDRARWASRNAATWRMDRWVGWEPGQWMAVLWGAARDLNEPANLKEALRRELGDRKLTLNTLLVTEQDLRTFARRVRTKRVRVMLGYARSLVMFARWVKERGERFPELRSVIASAEVLEEAEREEIEAALGVPVFDRYGCRELSVIACECPEEHQRHLNAENLWVEILADGRPAAAGEQGEVVITDLLNFGMPFLRYRIGDRAALLPTLCGCGRGLPLISAITGRVTDFLLLPDGSLVSGAALTILLVADFPGVRRVQLYQPRREELHVRVVPGEGYGPEVAGQILERARERMGRGVEVRVLEVIEIAAEPSGKLRFSISEAV